MQVASASNRLVAAGTLCLAFACSGQAQIRKFGNTYEFRAQYVKGSTITFDMSTLVVPFGTGASSAQQKITLPVVMRIQDVTKKAGTPTLTLAKIRSEAGPVLLNGKQFREKAMETVVVDQWNRLQSGGLQEVPQFTTPLPEKRIKLGGTWSSDIDASDSMPFSMTVKATYKLTKVDRTFAYIAVSLAGKGTGNSSITTKGQGTMVLRVRDGTLHSLKMTQTVNASPTMGARTTITVTRKV